MITMVARMQVLPENQPAYEALMAHVAAQVHANEADSVLYYAWAKSVDDPDWYVVIEVYRDLVVGSLEGRDLAGLRVVIDCANGAASQVAPAILQSRAMDDTGYVQPKINQLRAVRGTRSIYHNNAIQSWRVAPNGEVANVQVE